MSDSKEGQRIPCDVEQPFAEDRLVMLHESGDRGIVENPLNKIIE